MKTNKMIAAWLAASAIVMLSMGSASAMNGQGGGQWGKWMSQYITIEQRAELEKMSEEDRREFIQKLRDENGLETRDGWEWKQGGHSKEGKEDHDMGDMISDIEKQDVDATEIDLLEKQYEEEMMANELYMSFYDMYGVETFKNIAESEAQHMEAVKALLDRYDIATPTNYDHIKALYEGLKAKWALSLNDALEVWISIEKVDIDDIYTAILASDNDDIRTVLVNIWGASYNHMRGFVKALDNNDMTTGIDYSDYLNADDIDTKGSIKVKLAEKLEAENIELPEGATVAALNEKCDKEGDSHGDKDWAREWRDDRDWAREWKGDRDSDDRKWEMRDSKGKSEDSERNNDNANYNKYDNNSVLKAKYKSTYEVKYGSVISKMDDSDLDVFVSKIEDILEKVEIGNYSDGVKEKYNAMLLALLEIALDNIDDESIFEWIFD